MSDRTHNPAMGEGNPQPGNLTTGERERYRRLVELLDVPRNPAEVELLIFLSRWLTPPSPAVNDAMVRRANGRATASCRLLLAEVAEHLADARPPADTGFAIVYLPGGLVGRIREANAH